MREQLPLERVFFDEDGFLEIEPRPGYALLADYLASDLAGIGLGQYYEEVQRAALRGLDGGDTDEIFGNAFAVEVNGHTTTLTLLPRPELDLRLSTIDFLAAVEQVAAAVRERRLLGRVRPPFTRT